MIDEFLMIDELSVLTDERLGALIESIMDDEDDKMARLDSAWVPTFGSEGIQP